MIQGVFIPGHSLQRAVWPAAGPGVARVALECTCGQVFAAGLVSPIDAAAAAHVVAGGLEKGRAHLDEVARVVEQLKRGREGTIS